MPPAPIEGCLDFIGFLKRVFKCGGPTPGTTGANHELGDGFYIADDLATAIFFANNNAANNQGTDAMVCAIFAASQDDWRGTAHKAFLPNVLVLDAHDPVLSRQREAARLDHIRTAIPNVEARDVVKFSNLARYTAPWTAQMCAPNSITGTLQVECFPASSVGPDKPLPPGTRNYPEFSYKSDTIRNDWHIVGEPSAPEPEPKLPGDDN